jgi:hypothetical protein
VVYKSTELMKQFLTILFLGLSTLNAQVTTITKQGIVDGSTNKVINWDSIKYPGYQPQNKFDTVKVKIMYEQGDAIVPMFINGWQVLQLSKWVQGDIILLNGYGNYDRPDKWVETEIFLFDDKKTRIDNNRKWGYKQRQW